MGLSMFVYGDQIEYLVGVIMQSRHKLASLIAFAEPQICRGIFNKFFMYLLLLYFSKPTGDA